MTTTTTSDTALGVDLGNTCTNVCVSWPGCDEGLVAKIPSRYTYYCPPGQPNVSGQLGKPKAFPLTFTRNDENGGNFQLWFGQDTLAIPGIGKIDLLKYDAAHIQILFKAVLYQWYITHKGRHKVDLADLGRVKIVASMPPALFEDAKAYGKALGAYEDAFNDAHSHLQIRPPGQKTTQIVTHFVGLQQEAVAWGSNVPRHGEWIAVFDLGGGTNDFAIFNGSKKPRRKGSSNSGLIHLYEQINPSSPEHAELHILRNKKVISPELVTYYSDIEQRIQRVIRKLPVPADRIYIIGGGAALMPASVQKNIKQLAPFVFIGDEYDNCRANWAAAGGKK